MSWDAGDRISWNGHTGVVTRRRGREVYIQLDGTTGEVPCMINDPRDYYAGETVWDAWVKAGIAEDAARAMCIKYAFRMGGKGGEQGKRSDARKLMWYASKLTDLVGGDDG